MVKTKQSSPTDNYKKVDDNLWAFTDEEGLIHLVFSPEADGELSPRGHTKVVSTAWVKVPSPTGDITGRFIIIRKKTKE